jgi:hypothetical protein
MDRKYEIQLILKDLLKKIKEEIKENDYSTNVKTVLKSAEEVIRLSKIVEEYANELKSLI